MPHSLRAKLGGLRYKGILEDKDYKRLCKALDNEDVLEKIKAEIETKYGHCDICEYFEDYDYEENDISEYRPIGNIADILQILDKYKAKSENA